MLRPLLRCKIHRATITAADMNYVGSLTLDPALMEAAGLVEHERVLVANIDNGARFDTYVITGDPGSGEVCLNGAAARLGEIGDKVIIMAFAWVDENELEGFQPVIVHVDDQNRVVHP